MKNNNAKDVLFSGDYVRGVNEQLGRIKPFLFFAANWSPKPMIRGQNELNFRIAVSNGYGLFKDCANYCGSWLGYLGKRGEVDKKTREEITGLIGRFADMRGLFSHNQDENYTDTIKKIERVKKYIDDEFCFVVKGQVPFLLKLDEKRLMDFLDRLCADTENAVKIIVDSMENISRKPDADQNKYWEEWCDCVALWYSRSNNIAYQVMNDLSKVYGMDFKRYNFIEWLNKQRQNDRMKKLKSVIKNMNEPAYPQKVMYEYIQKYYIDGR